ncbi:MAG TPA: L-rhamnose/proton symporter RhaT [Terriglobia bacterium]|nr:L-rhamnose/proton symporter RhaT [Terriglobia bacterium]
MNLGILAGAGLVLLGGILQGLFPVPMKFVRKWNYENIWLIFALTGLVVFPWLLTFLTVPHLGDVYHLTSTHSIVAIAGFGLCWGAGATLTGLGLSMLGIGLGFAIILGLSASVGSLVPLLILTPEKAGTSQGHLYFLGTAVMLVGIALAARAGALRDKGKKPESSDRGVSVKGSFLAGLAVAIASGLLSSMLNFSYAFGTEALTQARHLGVSPLWMANVVAAPATSGGFVANFLYCAYLLRKNSTFKNYANPEVRVNWFHGAAMGALWFGGLAIYGLGIYRMGDFGTVVGWPLLMGSIILTSNAAGFLTGEWTGTGARVRAYLGAGMVIIFLALWILALAQKP